MIYKTVKTQLIKRPIEKVKQLNDLDNVTFARRKLCVIDEQFKQNIEKLVINTRTVKNTNVLNCATCRNANFQGDTCYYAALHPSDKRFKSSSGIPAKEAVKNCFGYEKRMEINLL